jgi:hypothetical protein
MQMNTAEQAQIEQASAPAIESVTVKLDQPIAQGDNFITQVVVRKPGSGALMGVSLMRLLNDADYDTMMKIIPRVTTPQISTLHFKNETLSLADMTAIHGEICGFFLTRAQRASLPQTE